MAPDPLYPGCFRHTSSRHETRFAATPAPLGAAITWMTTVGERRDDRLAALSEAVDPGTGDR